MTSTNQLQKINYANLAGYILNTLVTYGVGVSGYFPTNAELSAKYQTLVTPAGFAFGIWGIIFTAELIWTVAQMFPAYRSKELVLHGVGWYYVYACAAQISWTVFFSMEQIALSTIAMVCILIPLFMILTKTSKIPSESVGSYWLLKFPFEIHVAWIMAATLVNINVLLVALHVAASVQVAAAWTSLCVLAVTAFYFTYKEKWVVPSVLAWASNAIKSELSNPRESIVSAFSSESIEAIRAASNVLAGSIVVVIVLSVVYRVVKDKSETEEQDEPAAASLTTPLTTSED
eukprot:scaffold8206_cov135-Cylindrotheca_fusiformis.AAC.5